MTAALQVCSCLLQQPHCCIFLSRHRRRCCYCSCCCHSWHPCVALAAPAAPAALARRQQASPCWYSDPARQLRPWHWTQTGPEARVDQLASICTSWQACSTIPSLKLERSASLAHIGRNMWYQPPLRSRHEGSGMLVYKNHCFCASRVLPARHRVFIPAQGMRCSYCKLAAAYRKGQASHCRASCDSCWCCCCGCLSLCKPCRCQANRQPAHTGNCGKA